MPAETETVRKAEKTQCTKFFISTIFIKNPQTKKLKDKPFRQTVLSEKTVKPQLKNL
jgi:hypothetical protein